MKILKKLDQYCFASLSQCKRWNYLNQVLKIHRTDPHLAFGGTDPHFAFGTRFFEGGSFIHPNKNEKVTQWLWDSLLLHNWDFKVLGFMTFIFQIKSIQIREEIPEIGLGTDPVVREIKPEERKNLIVLLVTIHLTRDGNGKTNFSLVPLGF